VAQASSLSPSGEPPTPSPPTISSPALNAAPPGRVDTFGVFASAYPARAGYFDEGAGDVEMEDRAYRHDRVSLTKTRVARVDGAVITPQHDLRRARYIYRDCCHVLAIGRAGVRAASSPCQRSKLSRRGAATWLSDDRAAQSKAHSPATNPAKPAAISFPRQKANEPSQADFTNRLLGSVDRQVKLQDVDPRLSDNAKQPSVCVAAH